MGCKLWVLSSLWCEMHLCRQYNRWSLRCSWSITCWHCSNYIFILDIIPGCNWLGRDNCKKRRESFKFWDKVPLILEILRYFGENNYHAIMTLEHQTCMLANIALKTKDCQFDNFLITGGKVSCHYHNSLCPPVMTKLSSWQSFVFNVGSTTSRVRLIQPIEAEWRIYASVT